MKGKGSKSAVEARITALKNQLEQTSSRFDKEKIAKLQKDKTGVVIKEASTDVTSKSTDTLSPELSALNQRVTEASQAINEMRKHATVNANTTFSSHDELELMLKLKENSA